MAENLKALLNGATGITDDSRKVQKGFVFVAVKGLTVDGHDFVLDALNNGANVVIGQKNLDSFGAKYIKVQNSREALGILASNFYKNPSQKLKVIGVTGTKGKTTTCHLIYHILTKLGKKVGLVSSISAKIGDKEIDTGFHVTNPDVLSLQKFLSEMVDVGCEYAVVEVSSHGIDQGRIAGVNFEVGVLTNIASEHLDYHKTLKEYKRVKMSFVNSANMQVISPKSTKLKVLSGDFNNVNAATAVEVCRSLGFSEQDSISTLDSFELPSGRLEEVQNDLGIKIYVDFAHTPDSLRAVLTYLKDTARGRLISVFGCAGERDKLKRPKMGKIASELSDVVILTSEDPRTERSEDIIGQIRSGMKSNPLNVYEIIDRKKAIEFALKSARKGDVVGVFGKGHEKTMNLDGIHEIPWSDQDIIRDLLKEVEKVR